jgi:hypothetical protein
MSMDHDTTDRPPAALQPDDARLLQLLEDICRAAFHVADASCVEAHTPAGTICTVAADDLARLAAALTEAEEVEEIDEQVQREGWHRVIKLLRRRLAPITRPLVNVAAEPSAPVPESAAGLPPLPTPWARFQWEPGQPVFSAPQVHAYTRAAIAAHAQAADPAAETFTMEALVPGGEPKTHVQVLKQMPAGTKLYDRPAPVLAEHAFDHEAAQRLRAICGQLGLATAVPPDNATLMGAQFAVLGMMRGRIEKLFAAAAAPDEQPTGQVYGIIDPDYGRVYTIARKLAWEEGYAIGLHGSFTRDLDLVAVPWTDSACEPEHLVRRIVDATDLMIQPAGIGQKPHGRCVWTLLFRAFGDPRFVDFSVMPRGGLRSAAAAEVQR